MKILLTTLLLIVLSITNAQTGLGDFKLNKTKVDYIVSKYPTFKEIKVNDSCPLVRKFYSEKYEILDVCLNNIYLTFYDDYLVDFKCDKDKLIDIYVVSKYGRPNIKQFIDTIRVERVKYDEEVIIFKWVKDDIITISTSKRMFNEYFNVIVESYFNIYDEDKKEKIIKCNGNNN